MVFWIQNPNSTTTMKITTQQSQAQQARRLAALLPHKE
jgi:hypothetical protein